jgi:hypothetical protein
MSTENLKEKPQEKLTKEMRDAYKGGMFDQIDVPAITSFAICILIFVLVVIGVKSLDYSELNKSNLEDLSDRVAKIIMPLKPIGKPVPKPKPQGNAATKNRNSATSAGADASASARIERSRKTVTEQIGVVQQRITKAAVLSILSGKGPGAQGRTVGRQPRGGGFAGFGDLESKLGSIDGLTKFDGKKGAFNQDGEPPQNTKGDEIGSTSGIDKMVKGFQNAKSSVLQKIGVAEFEKPELLERASDKYTGKRSLQEVASFINQKQSVVSMLYEERLKVNPALEGKITVVLVIEEDGTVSSATSLRNETTLDDSEFIDQLLRRVKRWVFPPSSGGPVQMKSPFVFRPT